uniref:Nucleoprotein TPR n=1 Tax=Ditylenchus dipsaci TaxID=166011 RepID=A0A915CVB1_9BILA
MATSFSSIATKLASLPSLERVIEDEPEQLQYWYEQLVELELPDQLEGVDNGSSGFQEIDTIFQSMRLIMQYEHTNAEELKEVAEREAVEMAEKEENWEMDRDMLKEEISGLRERITSKAGIDETNEAFRAEIDSLTTENAYLKQLGRERDRELADQTAKAEELSSRLETMEKERGLFVNNQAQLEDTIREMNRRISSKSDVSQKGEWESRKLRQRNEQAVLLSDQLQNVITQNDQLKSEVDRLTEALENATALIQDSATKYADFGEQLAFAERSIEHLLADNKELKGQLNDKEGQLTERQQHVSSFSNEFHTVLQSKNAQIEQLRERAQKNELEIEELRARLELHQNQDREEELERLRHELVSATETARKLFGDAMVLEEQEQSGSKVTAVDPLAELRVRLLQMDKQLEVAEQQVALLTQDKTDMLAALEQKDLANARLNAHNQRLRQLAYGEASGEVQRLEKQLEFRDSHLQQLTHTCTLLQVQLQQLQEKELNGGPMKGKDLGGRHPKEQPSRTIKPKKVVAETRQQQTVEVEQPSEVAVNGEEAIKTQDEETANRQDEGGAIESAEPPSPKIPPTPTQYYFMKPQVREEVEANAAVLKSLYQEIVRLVQDVESKDKELQQTTKVHQELQFLLTTSKKETSNVQKQLTELRELVYGEGQQDHTGLLLHDQQKVDQDQLTIENMELKRLVETIETSGSELERRMAEGTRRLIFLAIQNSRLERRAETEQRLRQAISQEMARLNERLRRWSMGEEKKSRQVMAENEVNLVEVARLQNALLHSVPLAEYNRLLKDFKQMVHAQTVAGGRGGTSVSSDAGYQSAEDESSQAYQFNISQSSILLSEGRASDELLLKNRQLEELNQVLESQNDFWQRECQKNKAQIEELSAFLTDLENETEVKSMIANIERRFLQALREQFDSVQEQMISEKQLSNLEKQLHKRRKEWCLERQHLVNVVANLHTLLRRQIANTPLPISMEHLVAFRESMETVRQKELLVDRRTNEIDQTSSQLQTKLALAEAARASIEEIVTNDYQLQYIQSTLQGYQLNIITLSGEVNKLREQLQKANKELTEKGEEVDQLNQQLQTFNFTDVDLDWMVGRHKEHLKQENVDVTLGDKQKQQDEKPANHTEIQILLRDDLENPTFAPDIEFMPKDLSDGSSMADSPVMSADGAHRGFPPYGFDSLLQFALPLRLRRGFCWFLVRTSSAWESLQTA